VGKAAQGRRRSRRKQLNQYTRYLTVVLALFQSFGIAVGLSSQQGLVYEPAVIFVPSTIAVLTGGTMFLMWLGEQITARGVGNGVSLIIFSGIVARLPAASASCCRWPTRVNSTASSCC